MRIITFNLNGIRSAAQKGFFDWLAQQQADIICLQETKAHQSQLVDECFFPKGYHCYYHDAEKKGYSGVALYTRILPQEVIKGIGWPDIDSEGRYLEVRFSQGLRVVSLYVPSGSAGDHRQEIKFNFMKRFTPYLSQLQNTSHHYIFCGDWNVAHHPIDLKNWKSNQKHSGFLPEERAWIDEILTEWVDAFRVINPHPEQYTWWSARGRAWENNVGWRIDYQIVSPALKEKIKQVWIDREHRFSDHAPLIIDYEDSLLS